MHRLVVVALLFVSMPAAAAPEPTPRTVTVDGRVVPVHAGLGDAPTSPLPPARDDSALLRRLALGDKVSAYVLHIGARTIVRTWRHTRQEVDVSDLIDVAGDGKITRHTLPVNGREWKPAVCGGRWLVMALESECTVVWDLDKRALVAHVPFVGRFGNAYSDGPACSPDAAFVALPTPYGGGVTIVRLIDGKTLAYVPFDAAGTVRWTEQGITIWSSFLPYE